MQNIKVGNVVVIKTRTREWFGLKFKRYIIYEVDQKSYTILAEWKANVIVYHHFAIEDDDIDWRFKII